MSDESQLDRHPHIKADLAISGDRFSLFIRGREDLARLIAHNRDWPSAASVKRGEELRIAMPDEAVAQFKRGERHYHGIGVPQDYKLAASWYRKAADLGHAQAQYYLGLMYQDGRGVPQDSDLAALWYRKAAEQDYEVAQVLLGELLRNGPSTLRDLTEALVWLRRAADKGDAYAQNSLGLIYTQGNGVPRDYAQAQIWFSKAAETAAGAVAQHPTRAGFK